MENCKEAYVPINPRLKLKQDMGSDLFNTTQYQSLIERLIHLQITSPDVMFAINLCSKYMEAPPKAHLIVAKHILRYLKGTI